jgi:hypothetical protein
MKYFFLALAVLALPGTASAWQITVEKEADGREFRIAEQPGDGGNFLNLVCHYGKIHIEIIIASGVPDIDDTAEVMQVDDRPEHLVAGYVERIDNITAVFVGVDRRDEPAASTSGILREMAAGNALYWGDPDIGEAVERWSMQGSGKAIAAIRDGC